MIVILSEPTEKDMEIVKAILGDRSIEVFEIGSESSKVEAEWLSPIQFVSEMKKRGYSCKTSKTRKKLCTDFGIKFKKEKRMLMFRNDFTNVPPLT